MSMLLARPARALLAALAVTTTAIGLTACGGASPSATTSASSPGAKVALKIAEPVHGVGYLPLYVGIDKGFFAQEGLDVSTVTLAGGSAHTNAVLTGQAWGFIGGPEHDAFAKAKGASLKSIVNIVNRGNSYLVAPKGVAYTGDLAGFLKGKTIVTSAYGGTPNSITRYLLQQTGLKAGTDVKLIETGDLAAMLTIVKQGQAQVAVTSEPVLGKGVTQGIWGEPFYNVPKELGPYAYSTINITQDSITKDPASVQKFVRGMIKALAFVDKNRDETFQIAKKEFPTFDPAVLKATIQRSYDDNLWDFSGRISNASLDTALNVVRASGVLKDQGDPVKYADIIDMSFVDKATAPVG
jgi:NitT/TauT family transport system substrate-binding protein